MSAAVCAALGDVAIVAAGRRSRPSLSSARPLVSSDGGEQALVEAVDEAELQAAIRSGIETLQAEAEEPSPDVLDLDPVELRGVLEALLLVATKPLKLEQILKCLPGARRPYLEGFLAGLAWRFSRERRGWELARLAGGWQLLTRADFHPWVRRLSRKELPSRLSKSALEALAIVAYKQPITRGQIEDIRGVQCGPMLRQLMDMKLVMVTGREDKLLGRPLLYGTTDDFLTRFGLGSTDDLPRSHELG